MNQSYIVKNITFNKFWTGSDWNKDINKASKLTLNHAKSLVKAKNMLKGGTCEVTAA